jgi:hypothetical protein
MYVPLTLSPFTILSPQASHRLRTLVDSGAVGHDYISASALVRLKNLAPGQQNLNTLPTRYVRIPVRFYDEMRDEWTTIIIEPLVTEMVGFDLLVGRPTIRKHDIPMFLRIFGL